MAEKKSVAAAETVNVVAKTAIIFGADQRHASVGDTIAVSPAEAEWLIAQDAAVAVLAPADEAL